jgi:hypothetical protein
MGYGTSKEMTRAKTQSTPSSEKKIFFAPWRLGAINFVELIWFKI